LRKLSPAFQKDVFGALDVRKSIDARKTTGAPSTANVAAQLKKWRKLLK
jgi:argininosuccinate lyase